MLPWPSLAAPRKKKLRLPKLPPLKPLLRPLKPPRLLKLLLRPLKPLLRLLTLLPRPPLRLLKLLRLLPSNLTLTGLIAQKGVPLAPLFYCLLHCPLPPSETRS